MDFEDPVTAAAARVNAPHRLVRSGRDVPLGGRPGDLLVRELSDQMTGNGIAELKALGTSDADDEVKKFSASDVRVSIEIVAPGLPHPWQGIADGGFVRIVAQHKC